ncbi:acyl carrier protein [Desulfotalea psychrophila]|uniref:Related to acyl carrier protein n=1 Tax=Desulfotalea psychrophila (strain LSv54 / DSM 12343) TaxID=177439 RepID=Q6ALF3_DESPS|nr:phosphopantetheine-binding protein [Desulfotalea psychrophila]CAG36822.1 related to acyl carrier protein [Desulfotalea psychrophila LSv54]
MRKEQIKETILRALQPITPEADLDGLAADENMQDALDIDSFDVLTFFVKLYEELGVEIPEEDYGQIITLNDLIGYLAARID